jgi:lipoprotein-releasing system ATP-binding protein
LRGTGFGYICAVFVRISNLFKSYGSLPVLKGLNLEINAGEVVSIVGASGAGKTTLLHILGTLDSADSGTVEVKGVDITRMKPAQLASFRNRELGFIFQFHQLLPEFTALENVCLPAWIAGKDKKKSEEEALSLLRLLDIEARAGHKPSELSGGEQQRVAVARALINRPALVLADEPSGNLDSNNARELHALFFKLRKELGQTFVIVTHNPDLADMADRKLTMKDGVFVSIEN